MIEKIDQKFAEIQRLINEQDLPESKKEDMISLCIQANEMLVKILEN